MGLIMTEGSYADPLLGLLHPPPLPTVLPHFDPVFPVEVHFGVRNRLPPVFCNYFPLQPCRRLAISERRQERTPTAAP